MKDFHWVTIPTRERDTVNPNNGQVTRTIHYVFRKLSDPTLITGGEVLTWAGLRRWLCLLKHQELSETEPEVTTDKAGNWVACLIELVKQRREAQDWDNNTGGREELERWNHFDTINDFFEFQG
ncbi:hypothetical protein ACJA88_014847 [Fusarium oxysporum]